MEGDQRVANMFQQQRCPATGRQTFLTMLAPLAMLALLTALTELTTMLKAVCDLKWKKSGNLGGDQRVGAMFIRDGITSSNHQKSSAAS